MKLPGIRGSDTPGPLRFAITRKIGDAVRSRITSPGRDHVRIEWIDQSIPWATVAFPFRSLTSPARDWSGMRALRFCDRKRSLSETKTHAAKTAHATPKSVRLHRAPAAAGDGGSAVPPPRARAPKRRAAV